MQFDLLVRASHVFLVCDVDCLLDVGASNSDIVQLVKSVLTKAQSDR